VTACSSSSPSPPIGTVADSGFRPARNGFSFQNYGGQQSTPTLANE
jgi:hypothetical protein